MTRSSPRKRPLVSYKEDDGKPVTKPSVAGRALGSLKSAAAKLAAKPAPKRKAERDDAAELQPTVAASQPKKRKTATAKDEDTMPLADRTAISSLTKAMYIGAHVSAAGGMLPITPSGYASTKTKQRTKFALQVSTIPLPMLYTSAPTRLRFSSSHSANGTIHLSRLRPRIFL